MKRKATAIILSLVVAVGMIGLLARGLAVKFPATGLSGFALVGRPAPDFTLPLFDGDTVTLSEHIGQPIVLNFWASWCVPCRIEAPILENAWRKYNDKGVLFVGVDIQDVEEDARAYLRELKITYPNGRDGTGHITVDYGVSGIPVTFVVDGDGSIVRRWVGAIDQGTLDTWIGEVVAMVAASGGIEGENLSDIFNRDE